jgi:photosystem II stability/assembly factor-like uncharacterized protein
MDAGTVNFNAVAGSQPDQVFVVGDQGTILYWNGISLRQEVSGTANALRGVAVFETTLAFAVGEQGTLLRRQTEQWSLDPPITLAVLNAVCAGPDWAVAVGEQGTILVFQNGVWSLVPNTRNDNYYTVTQGSAGVLIGGALGVIVHVNVKNQTITNQWAIPGYTKVLAGSARFGEGVYFVGMDGGLFYWVSDKATRVTGLPAKFLRSISVVGSNAWMVGHEGMVASREAGAAPIVWPTQDDRWLVGVYAATASDIWFVGRSGLILRGPPGIFGVAVDGGVHD